jgi:hypothetical protein
MMLLPNALLEEELGTLIVTVRRDLRHNRAAVAGRYSHVTPREHSGPALAV